LFRAVELLQKNIDGTNALVDGKLLKSDEMQEIKQALRGQGRYASFDFDIFKPGVSKLRRAGQIRSAKLFHPTRTAISSVRKIFCQ